jgi:hypothetical protein
MSQSKFAPITAALLARKGNAMPSMAMPFAPARAVNHRSEDIEAVRPPPFPTDALVHHEHAKKLYVPLTHPEHERLAIAAVKTGLTRHQIVRDALDLYYEQLSLDMGKHCNCITGTCGNACQ